MADDTTLMGGGGYGSPRGQTTGNVYDFGTASTAVSALTNDVVIATTDNVVMVAAPAAGKTVRLWGWSTATAGSTNTKSLVANLRNTGETVNKIRLQGSLQGPQFVRLAVPVDFPNGITLNTVKTASAHNYVTLIYTSY